MITEAISNPTIRVSTIFPTLLGNSVEAFLKLCDDNDADVRMTSEECLNRIIRVCSFYTPLLQIERFRMQLTPKKSLQRIHILSSVDFDT